MKLFVAFGLFSLAAAQLRPWPSWLSRFPGGTPKLPPWIDFHILPGREYNGITDPANNFQIGQSCSVQYEKRLYKGTCQKDDDFSKSAFGGCPEDVSLYGCGSERGDRNSIRCCVKVPCGKHYEKNYCSNKYKQPALFNAFHIDPNLCPFAEDIACWVYELGQGESPQLHQLEDPALDSNFPTLQPSSTASDPNSSPQVESDSLSTPSDPNSSSQVGSDSLSTSSDPNSSSQVGSDTLSSPPLIRRRPSKARTSSSDLESLAAE